MTNINIAVWFEVPALDFDRAVAFYQAIFGYHIEPMEMGGMMHGLFPHPDTSKVSGAIVCGEGYQPSQQGSLIYFHGGDDLDTVLSKVASAGGSVEMAKTHLGEDIGYIAIFIDTEGNRIGLHCK